LFVEDEWFLREMAVGVLDSAGYRVLKARDAAEAMNLFRRYRKIVDMLLTDVVLPGRDGGVLANEMRADKTALKVVFISGYAENVVARQSCSGDKTLYLPKPFSAESLLEKIDQVLSTE
jgi:CheY-like chemotaxis protein